MANVYSTLLYFLPMAIPSKMAWIERARTMTKLLMAAKIFLSFDFVSELLFLFTSVSFDFDSDGASEIEVMLPLWLPALLGGSWL